MSSTVFAKLFKAFMKTSKVMIAYKLFNFYNILGNS